MQEDSLKSSMILSDNTVNQLNATIDRALDTGVFGVPTFIAKGELFWGNDRLILLRHYLNSQ
jgi:2-hydroxychromene-2-carboxylate isomerase